VNGRPLVVAGGPILTMAEPPRVEAVALHDDRIAWAGSLEECRARAGPDREERDLGGRTLLPGFVDAHIHPLMLGQTRSWIDVGPAAAPSIEAMVERLRHQAATFPPGQPVHGYGYDLRRVAEGRHPTAAELDRAAPDREVTVMHASGHGGVVNSVVLAQAGIGAATADVPGGEIGRAPDGTLVGRTAWFPEGYPGDPRERGLLYHDPAEFRALLARAHAAGLQTATHALSPAAIGLVLDGIEEAERASPRPDARHRIEHCALPTIEQVARMARLGAIPVAQSQHAHAFGDGAIAAVGRELGERYHPLGLYARSGVRFALSSDAPVAPPAPLQAVQAAVERRTVLGTALGPDDLRVDVEDALRAYTIDAAWACHADRLVGSIEPGKLADLVILSADPTSVPTTAIGSIAVEETWSAGEPVH